MNRTIPGTAGLEAGPVDQANSGGNAGLSNKPARESRDGGFVSPPVPPQHPVAVDSFGDDLPAELGGTLTSPPPAGTATDPPIGSGRHLDVRDCGAGLGGGLLGEDCPACGFDVAICNSSDACPESAYEPEVVWDGDDDSMWADLVMDWQRDLQEDL